MSIGNMPTITVDDPLSAELQSAGLLSTGILLHTNLNRLFSADSWVLFEASLNSKITTLITFITKCIF